MRLFSNLTQTTRKILATTALVAGVVLFGAMGTAHAANVSFSGTTTDCDANAVIRCGALSSDSVINKYTNGDGSNSASSIHNIYSYFGISSSDVNNLKTTAVAGSVTKSGNVYVGDQLVATNAVTAGRQDISGSTKVSSNSTTFYKRTPSVSFKSDTLKAYVVMKNGVFDYAILSACGNPVNAAPKKPNYDVSKGVRVKGDSSWKDSVSVKSGTHVEYRIFVKSTGTVPVTNVVVNDTLPANVTYVNNTLKRDGATASTNFFSSGDKITSIDAGKTVVYTFEAIVGSDDTSTSCVEQTVVNTAYISTVGLPKQNDTATVNKGCEVVPATPTTPEAPVVPETPPTPVVPATPQAPVTQELPHTGAGAVISLFGAVVVVASLAHRLFLDRRLTR